jgi:hypothetical protein
MHNIIQLLSSVPLNMMWYSPAGDILTEATSDLCEEVKVCIVRLEDLGEASLTVKHIVNMHF